MTEGELHEQLTREENVVGSSDRSFGLILAAVGLLVGAVRLWRGQNAAWWWVAAAAVLASLAICYPNALSPLNRLWLRLGLVLSKVMNPVVLALIFIIAVLPTGLLLRALGKDLLRLRREPQAATYWIARAAADASAGTMKQQF